MITTDSAGGVWDHTITLATSLRRHGHDPVIAHMGPQPRPAQRQQAAFHRLPLHASGFALEWAGGLDQANACQRWLDNLADELHVDLIHCNSYSHVNPAQARPQLLGAHSTVHGWWRAVHGENPPAIWQRYEDVVRDALSVADLVVAPTYAMLHELEALYDLAHGWVVYNGISAPTRYDATAAERDPYVFTSGRLWDQGKGHHILDAASATSPWPVHAAGSLRGPDHTAHFEHMRPAGFLSRDELEHHYAHAGLYANPALYEPFGLGALEAATNGCPLILSDLPTHRELWRGAARFVPPGDIDAWRAALIDLTNDPIWREALSEAAWHHARRYTHLNMAAGYSAAYEAATAKAHERHPLQSAQVPT